METASEDGQTELTMETRNSNVSQRTCRSTVVASSEDLRKGKCSFSRE